MNLDYSPVFDEQAQPAGVIAMVVETTERVLAERELQGQQARLQQMFEQAPGMMAMLRGPEHVFEMVNPAYCRLVGEREIIGKPVRDALPEVERQGFIEILDRVYRSGEAFVGSGIHIGLQRTRGAAEEDRVLDFVFQPVTDIDGNVGGIFVEGHDVTERARADLALRETSSACASSMRCPRRRRAVSMPMPSWPPPRACSANTWDCPVAPTPTWSPTRTASPSVAIGRRRAA